MTLPRAWMRSGLLTLALIAGWTATAAWAGLPIQHWTTPQGARVYLVESPALPMLDVQIDFDAGARRDPAGKAGLADFTAGLLDNGVQPANGDPALNEFEIGERWADLGASFGGEAGGDRMSFSLRTLTFPEVLPKAVALAARLIAHPAYPAEVLAREQSRAVAAIKQALTQPGPVAGKAFARAVYSGHPYGVEADEASVSAITRDDLLAFHRRYVRAGSAVVTLVGAVGRPQAEAIVAELLNDLPQDGAGTLPAIPEVPPLAQAAEQRIAFDAAQAHVLIGQPGMARGDPDYFALFVGNYILGGGGFVSRLSTEVREKRGLAYSVYSYFSPGLHRGAFTIGLQTRSDQADQALALVRETLERFVREGPTEAEVKAAKDYLIGGFALRLDSNRKLLDNVATIAYHRQPLDYLDTWTQKVGQLSAAQIRDAFRRRVQPERMVTVVVGGVSQ